VRWLVAAGVGGVLLVAGGSPAALRDGGGAAASDASSAAVEASPPIISDIEFVGLRYISPAAVQAQISSHAGERVDASRIESDVKVLGRLGWFSDVRVEMQPAAEKSSPLGTTAPARLVFVVEEIPFLARVEYTGSKLLSAEQIEKILADRKLTPRMGEPAAPGNLARVATAIRSALAELAHPEARVQIRQATLANGRVGVGFAIDDGPHIPVGHIEFEGQPEVSARLLRREMQRTAPGALFSSWRDKGAYTPEGYEEDRARILIYYQNHGFPEARVGTARTSVYDKRWSHRIFWRRRGDARRMLVTVPISAGAFYQIEAVKVSAEIAEAGRERSAKLLAFSDAQAGQAYSARAAEDLRRAWAAAIQPKRSRGEKQSVRRVECSREFDPRMQTVREKIRFEDEPEYVVRRIEFQGLHRFSDRYLRRRIGLQEGYPFDERGLEAGLARVARTGYFRQIKKEDIQVRTDDVSHTADVTIRVSEAGQQHASFSGGQGQFGSTLGVAYSLFDLLQQEELLSARFDAGPASLQIVLGLAMEGLLGSRSSVAFSIFNNILRPRLAGGLKGPFYSSQSEGLNANLGYPLTAADALAANYTLARTKTGYSLALPPHLTGAPGSSVRAETSSSSVGAGWTRDSGSEKFAVTDSVSGGWLGGTENVIRSNEEYAHIFADPLFSRQNAWAFRTTFSGAGSYSGEMPFYARLFSGDAQVRGLSPGDLGPYEAVATSSGSSGNPS
jgi:outer membrane protein insertion porin family